LRAALRSLLTSPLKDAAKGFDDAYVLWRRENDELVSKVAYGDILVDDGAIKNLEESRDLATELNRTLASAAPPYQQMVGLDGYASADLIDAVMDDEALVYYAYDKSNGLFAVVVTKTRRAIYDLNAFANDRTFGGSGDLEEIVGKYLSSLVDPKAKFDEQASEDLYRRLISPIEDEIRGKRHLIIIPEGSLLNIPFAALRKPS